MRSIIVVGGGAAGFFAAIAAMEQNSDCKVILLERSAQVLSKVKISGGGRCNVTHACFDPAELVRHYPRGGVALRGPFSRFQPRDTVAWFEAHGVALKTEADNRIFPTTDQSETIIRCLRDTAEQLGIVVRVNAHINEIQQKPFRLMLGSEEMTADRLILATGSAPQGWVWAKLLGHSLISPVPSLFTFKIQDPRLHELAGISVRGAQLNLDGSRLKMSGPLLITHEGLSGPAVLRLSAWEARSLHDINYQTDLHVNWLGDRRDKVEKRLSEKRLAHGRNLIAADPLPEVPRRLWSRLVKAAGIDELAHWTEVSNELFRALADQLTDARLTIRGKSTFKDEFVTAGGIPIDEVDFRTMESKRCPGLYFAGEILDIDGETGGFNFQNAWTTGWLAGRSASA
jgi:predicted Rossmann fold flavoprotein